MYYVVLCSAFRKESGVSEEVYKTLREMRGTPISYIVNQTPIQVAVGEKEYPIGLWLKLSGIVKDARLEVRQHAYNVPDLIDVC